MRRPGGASPGATLLAVHRNVPPIPGPDCSAAAGRIAFGLVGIPGAQPRLRRVHQGPAHRPPVRRLGRLRGRQRHRSRVPGEEGILLVQSVPQRRQVPRRFQHFRLRLPRRRRRQGLLGE